MSKATTLSEVTESTRGRVCIEIWTQITMSGGEPLTYRQIGTLLRALGDDLAGRWLSHGAATRGPTDDEVDPGARGPGDDEVDPGGG